MLTPRLLETKLQTAADQIAGDLNTLTTAEITARITDAKTHWHRYRIRRGFKTSAPILSESIGKTQKNRTRTLALALMPHKIGKVANVCAFEDQCAKTCVAFSGKGTMSTVQKARTMRTTYMAAQPKRFFWLIVAELDRANRTGDTIAVRMNAFSDLRWERIAPWIFDRYPGIRFYDYTKHPLASRPVDTLPRNYRLTYSASPKTTADEFAANLRNGRNVAVVFPNRANTTTHRLPNRLAGFRVIDGDKTDERYADPSGVVVGLRRKGSLTESAPLATVAHRLTSEIHG